MGYVNNPDKWMIIKISGKDPHYRVFASWSGGYLDGDSWKMNSGIVSVNVTDDHYDFIGSSGSVYHCHKETYGANMYGMGVATSYQDKLSPDFEIMSEAPDVENMDWIIT